MIRSELLARRSEDSGGAEMMQRYVGELGKTAIRTTTHSGTHCTTERVYSRPDTAYQGVDRDGGH